MSFLTHTHSLSLCFQIDLDTSHPNMKLTTLALCALSLASLGLCSTQAVSTTTLLTSVSCINHKICADPPTRRNSYTFSYTSTPWTTPKATPSTGSNGYGYPIATHTICATDNMSCSTSVDCGNVNSTAVWWPAFTTPCTTVNAAEPACTAKPTGAYSCMPVEHVSTSTEDYGGRGQRWISRLTRATSKKSEGYVTPPGTTTTTKVPWTHSWVPAPTHCYSCIRPSSRSSTTRSTVKSEVTPLAE
ncbi:hypothetical protein HRS9122_05023 [Pyrenophora teres f. teres]|nr:hypothetical protein HRS9122_05023 [Pyrenophora teres f. teres]